MQWAQMLLTMRGKTTTPLTSIMLVLLTKAIIVFEKLESWHTAFDADNNSKPLPRQYSILL